MLLQVLRRVRLDPARRLQHPVRPRVPSPRARTHADHQAGHALLHTPRDRAEHTRKRKIVSHVFSQKNVLQFSRTIDECLTQLTAQWDALLAKAAPSEAAAPKGAVFDTLPWFNFLAFDIIGSLAFGRPFGMLETGQDAAIVGRDEASGRVLHVEAIKVLNERGEVSATLGCLTPWMRCVSFTPPALARAGVARDSQLTLPRVRAPAGRTPPTCPGSRSGSSRSPTWPRLRSRPSATGSRARRRPIRRTCCPSSRRARTRAASRWAARS